VHRIRIAAAFEAIRRAAVARRVAAGVRANWLNARFRLAHGLFDHHHWLARRVAIIIAVVVAIVVAVIVAAIVVTAVMARAALTRAVVARLATTIALGKSSGRKSSRHGQHKQGRHSEFGEAFHDSSLHTELFCFFFGQTQVCPSKVWSVSPPGMLQTVAKTAENARFPLQR
jgi:hypothetical protein